MEENFDLTWEDSTTVQTEEVICGIESEILPSDEFHGGGEVAVEEVVEEGEVIMTDHTTEEGEVAGIEEVNKPHDHDGMALSDTKPVQSKMQSDSATTAAAESIMYLTDNMLMMEHQQDAVTEEYDTTEAVEEEVVEHVVQEEVITGEWGEGCPEEIVVGSEEAVGTADTNQDECDIPLPTDQDEYTAARPYPCDFCSRRFRKKANLMNHMVAHQTDRPHGCNLCGVRYMRKSDLMNHLKIHAYIPEGAPLEEGIDTIELDDDADKKKRMKAQLVKKKKKGPKIKEDFEHFEVASSSRSYNYVAEDMEQIGNNVQKEYQFLPEDQQEETRFPIMDPRKPFVCQHCGVGFAREKALYSHTRLHAEGDSPFECQKCGEMFWDSGQMREHKKQKHGDLEEYDDGDEDGDYSEEDSRYGTFYCTTCGLSFHRQDNLRRHQRVHVKEEYANEAEYAHVCNVCGESFTEALDLLAHAEIHARTSEHRCMICGEVLQDETSLAVHVQAKHGKNLPPNTCMLCGRACKDRRTLLKHSWEHSKEKVFNCPKCNKTFHNKARLKRHMLSHRNKVVSCEVCGEEFPDGRSLMNHRHSHSSVSGRQFPCRECGKTFGSRSSQQIHIRIHTGERPYGCRFCWKAFADGGTLRKHERIHTGEKPYACAVCPRAFNQRVVLREHIRSHHSGPDPKYSNSMTPYCCAVCSDMFATSQDLILHLIHHCDMNTAMKRQPQVGPRKYKRRRKLKPHELELISGRIEGDDNDNNLDTIEDHFNHIDESEEEPERRRRQYGGKRGPKKASGAASPGEGGDEAAAHQEFIMFDEHDAEATAAAVESLTNPSPNPNKQTPTKNKQKKLKGDQSVPSRPKMIHTQKTRVPVETYEDGRIKHKTKTLVTRTQPAEIKSSTGDRIRPRTKNVSYHVLQPEKLPLATFPDLDSDTQQAVDSILKEENLGANETIYDTQQQTNGIVYMDTLDQPPGVAAEQTVETEVVSEIFESRRIRTRSSSSNNGVNASLKPGRHVIGPGSKVRLIKEGMIVSKAKTLRKSEDAEPESILPDVPNTNDIASVFVKGNESPTPEDPPSIVVKQEIIIQPEMVNVKQEMPDPSPSPLHELAEISMQHANASTSVCSASADGLFRCEMCSEVFGDRAQLLVHVPVHI